MTWQFRRWAGRGVLGGVLVALMAAPALPGPDDRPGIPMKTESFDRDPGWEGHNNHILPKVPKTVRQDFGYSPTHFAGKEKGEIGGRIWRSPTPAYYAARIPPKNLNDPLSASGSFALTSSSGSSGVFFGWFNSAQPGGGRQSTLGLHFDGEGGGARLALNLVTAQNQSCGTKVTPWIVDNTKPADQRRFRPTSIRNDGTRYAWTLEYDPRANDGDGQLRFTIRSDKPNSEEFEGKTFTVAVPKAYKQQGTTFDRFGLVNGLRPGNSLAIFFDDLRYDGRAEDFSLDPGWIGVGNHASYERTEEGGAHNFGFSADTRHAGGAPGELGGTIWRSGPYAYYADRVGPLTLSDRLEARGKVVLTIGPPDSGLCLGWFNSADKENAPTQVGNFLGVRIGGPTRVGHYFLPAYAIAGRPRTRPAGGRENAASIAVGPREGPVLVPQKVFEWKLVYDPAGNGGKGVVEATLGNESVRLPLKDGHKAAGAAFDRFGLCSLHVGGSFVKIYFDDLKYTAAPAR